jgi:hypothetical protein
VAQRAHINHTHGVRRSFFGGRNEEGKEKFGEIEVTCHNVSEDLVL